ncbi:hypothetical protein BV25DRAFT_1129269 [Artomyces pyxidatus]|uniref:Uncharacterized protein n=1 Tax=Artomyces pyxidatus TaxID=48021 RepID=A0ACB8STN2_9AGAM|nr:hypothetical protein BV25DRAFT_1129269 [Artomyces pyxidatus]
MPPWTTSSPFTLLARHRHEFSTLKTQWQNPNDILSILMIIGGDIVQRAVAQLAGSGPYSLAPVAFSFGWVAYSINTVLSAVGDGRLMPATDCPSILVNAKNGHIRNNQSWVLGRLLRDHRSRHHQKERGLTVSMYHASTSKTPGVPDHDWVYYSGVTVIIVQLGIAVIPGAIHGDWMILLITGSGTLLALSAGALPQWRAEKWAARRLPSAKAKREVVSLTRGNGSKDVIVIVNEGTGFKLEDLAATRDVRSRYTIFVTCALAVLWIAHLLIVAGLQNDAWYSFAVGALGMIQNVVAAGARRSSGAQGIHLERERVVYEEKLFRALKEAEGIEPGVGLSLLPVFFPGGLKKEEEAWRQERLEERATMSEKRLAVPPTPSMPRIDADSKDVSEVVVEAVPEVTARRT